MLRLNHKLQLDYRAVSHVKHRAAFVSQDFAADSASLYGLQCTRHKALLGVYGAHQQQCTLLGMLPHEIYDQVIGGKALGSHAFTLSDFIIFRFVRTQAAM